MKNIMQNAFCALAVVPMRKEPAHRSEMVSQLTFGEFVSVVEYEKQFIRVQCLTDDYEGWVQESQLVQTSVVLRPVAYASGWINEVMVNDEVLRVPFGVPMHDLDEMQNILNIKIAAPDIAPYALAQPFSETALAAVYEKFLGSPYLWGGRSVFGIDCSGFAQQVLKFFGVKLLRDAYLQAGQGNAVDELRAAKAGDLAFFDNEAGKITHVGLLLAGRHIVHASGSVRIDTINEEGIVHSGTGIRTHRLHSIRRFFP